MSFLIKITEIEKGFKGFLAFVMDFMSYYWSPVDKFCPKNVNKNRDDQKAFIKIAQKVKNIDGVLSLTTRRQKYGINSIKLPQTSQQRAFPQNVKLALLCQVAREPIPFNVLLNAQLTLATLVQNINSTGFASVIMLSCLSPKEVGRCGNNF